MIRIQFMMIKNTLLLRSIICFKEGVRLFTKLYIFFLIFLNLLYAEPVVKISTSAVSIDKFKMGYLIDESENMSFDQVQKQKFIQGSNNLTLGTTANVTWVKIILLNETDSSKELFLHNAVAYHAESIHFYEVEDNTLINDIRFEPRHYVNTEEMYGAEALYTLTLKPGQTKSIYMQSHFLAYQLIELSIYDQKASTEDLVHRFMPIVILFSILATLALYYFILYISAGYKEYIYYSLYLISSSVFLAYCYGMVSHYFHIYGEWGLKLTALAIVSPIFLALFIKSIFKTKENYRLQDHFINSIIVIFSLTYLYSFFEYYQAIEFTSILFVYFLIVMLGVSISLYRKNAPMIKYFFIAHIFYLIFSLIAILFYNSGIEYNYLTSHSIAIGTMFEALILGFLVSYRIRLLESDNKEKEKIISIDAMTSLYNKSHFEERLEKELLIHRRDKSGLTLMIIDIDYFKQYNDTYGHLEGDKTLIRVARSLQNSLKRPSDMAFRVGGEEFAILCTGMEDNMAVSFANKLRTNIENLKIKHKKSSVYKYITVSIGLYTVPHHYMSSQDQIYRHADSALYEAKSTGRNRVVAYEE
ncbi:MAG: hypothetical protein DRG09_00345 [Epsilonproteobacteria bacterium]|nr:MAG: hypothetical protein DRG09_00345 [Campylobacterota bacterium]